MFKHNPLSFHQRAMPAAIAAECARDQGEDKFWKVHDSIFENQRALEDADLEKYASGAGVDMNKWKECVKSQKPKDRIMSDQRTAMTLGARGTPAFFINGRYMAGAQPFPSFDNLVSQELDKAKKSGIAKGDYYTKAVVEKGDKKL